MSAEQRKQFRAEENTAIMNEASAPVCICARGHICVGMCVFVSASMRLFEL